MKISIRIFDFILALILGIILGLPSVIIAIFVHLSSEGPILFIQERLGHKGKKFKIYKFRTMEVGERDYINGEKKITKIGKILRKTKLDELPQLINILKGEMSFVGFRPESPEYKEYYIEIWKDYFELMPGITGKASIYYSNLENLMEASENPKEFYIKKVIPKKVELNKWHFENNNVWSNIKVMFETVWKLIVR